MISVLNPLDLLRPRRPITGMSAVLLPFTEAGAIDWPGWEAHLQRTVRANLIPAVNMDTGYVNLIDDATRREILRRTQTVLAGQRFVAGAFVADQPGDGFNFTAYARQVEQIQQHGGTPILFPSYGLTNGEVLAHYGEIAAATDHFLAFELGTMFVPFGKIYDLDTFAGLMAFPQCIGAKHSSLSRQLEWQRLQRRNEQRPDFLVLTGNDLAIDMVMYGSDYLLGLSTFAPDYFARRDACWLAGDPAFYELNDHLQALGSFAFRAPVPAYKHSAAQFLKLRGWLTADAPHPAAALRPATDLPILQDILNQLRAL